MLTSFIKSIVRYTARTFKYLWFIKLYVARQIAFNAKIFAAIVIYGQDFVVVEESDEALMVVNNYHTRYEGTERGA